jgi:dephospho-CoA kinase
VIVVGLTGSIAMGKSTVAAMFAEFGVPIFDADGAVRAFYAGEGARSVEAAFPGVTVSGQVDRERLGARVLGDADALRRLEGLVHPAVVETGGDSNVDLVVVVSAPESVQRARALAREGMTEAKLQAVLSRQTSDVEKKRRAHFVIDTRGSLDETRAIVAQFMRATAALVGGRARYA